MDADEIEMEEKSALLGGFINDSSTSTGAFEGSVADARIVLSSARTPVSGLSQSELDVSGEI